MGDALLWVTTHFFQCVTNARRTQGILCKQSRIFVSMVTLHPLHFTSIYEGNIILWPQGWTSSPGHFHTDCFKVVVASVSRHRLWIMRLRRWWVLLAAATAVAGESDTGVTVSAAFATGVGCWSGCWGACLPLGSLYAGCFASVLKYDGTNW